MAGEDVEQHLVVIPENGNQAASPLQSEKLVDGTAGIGAAVDVVAQRDHDVLRLGITRLENSLQCC
jgi:hypothetical protein